MPLKKVFNKAESFMVKLCILCLIIVIGMQLFIKNNDLQVFFDNQNQNVSNHVNNSKEEGILILKLENQNYSDFKYVEILKNGKIEANFSKGSEVTINVYNNDLIEINGAKYHQNLEVKIVGVSKNIELPTLNTTVHTSKSIEILGKVILK